MHGQNVLLIGKNSYIGSAIAEAAARAGAQVSSVSSRDCDLLDAGAAEQFFSRLPSVPYSVVFLAVINKTVENSFESFHRNTQLVRNFAVAQSKATVRCIVYFSSVDVYGRAPALPITERSPIRPDSWYGLSKYACEWILTESGWVDCPVTVLRIPGVFGPGPKDRSVIGGMVQSLRTSGEVRIHGSGNARRDYVFIDDVFQVVRAAIRQPHHGLVNVATGRSHSIVELASMLREVLGGNGDIRHEAADEDRDFDLAFDNKALLSLIPGFVFKDIRQGLAAYRK